MSPPPRWQFTVGWICGLSVEMAAAVAMLDEAYEDGLHNPVDGYSYGLGKIGGHNIVIACLPAGQYGSMSASVVANRMITSYANLRFIFSVGIGGGIPRKGYDIRLGDVVVSKPSGGSPAVVEWDINIDSQVEVRPNPTKPPMVLLSAVARLQAHSLTNGLELNNIIKERVEKFPKLREIFQYPGAEHDMLFEHPFEDSQSENSSSDEVDLDTLVKRSRREDDEPQVHYGVIASGNRLLKKSKIRNELGSKYRVLAVELEAAGLMSYFPCLVIRGIADYADSHKDKRWQGYAAATSAAYTRRLLQYVGEINVHDVKPLLKTYVESLERSTSIQVPDDSSFVDPNEQHRPEDFQVFDMEHADRFRSSAKEYV